MRRKRTRLFQIVQHFRGGRLVTAQKLWRDGSRFPSARSTAT